MQLQNYNCYYLHRSTLVNCKTQIPEQENMLLRLALKFAAKLKGLPVGRTPVGGQSDPSSAKISHLLEYVPPHQLISSSLVLQTFRQAVEASPQKAQKHFIKIVLPQLSLLHGFTLSSLIKQHSGRTKMMKHIKSSIYLRLGRLSFKEIAQIVSAMAKTNSRDDSFFRAVELEVYQRLIPFDLPAIQKFMKAFAHFNCGSAMLYTKICKTLRKAQHQLLERDLLSLSAIVARAREHSQGGAFLYRLLQEKLTTTIPKKSLLQLISVAEVVFAQNLCSNQLQTQLQERLAQALEQQLSESELTRLLHATSGYFYKFKDGCLQDKLEDRTVKLLEFMSPKSVELAVWSWARSRRGGNSLWQALERQCSKYLTSYSDRSFAFTVYALARGNCVSEQIFKRAGIELDKRLAGLHHHYLLKLYEGGRRLGDQTRLRLARELAIRVSVLSTVQLARFIGLLAESELDYSHGSVLQINTLLGQKQSMLIQKLGEINFQEAGQLYYFLCKTNFKCKLREQLFALLLEHYLQIPKQVFLKVLFSSIVADHFSLALSMIPVLNELNSYGEVPYFFSPRDFPLLWYSILQFIVNARAKGQFQNFSQQVVQSARTLRPMLNVAQLDSFRRQVLDQADRLALMTFK